MNEKDVFHDASALEIGSDEDDVNGSGGISADGGGGGVSQTPQ